MYNVLKRSAVCLHFHIFLETIEVTEKTEEPTTESEEKKEEIDFKEQKKDKDQTSKRKL